MLEKRVEHLINRKAGIDFPKRAELLERANALEVLREEHGPKLTDEQKNFARDRGLRARRRVETEQSENPFFALDKAAEAVMEKEPATSVLAADLSRFRSSLVTSTERIREDVSLEIVGGKTREEAIVAMSDNSKISPVSVGEFLSRGDPDVIALGYHPGYYYAGKAAHALGFLDPTVNLGAFLHKFAYTNLEYSEEKRETTTIVPTHAYPGIGVQFTFIDTTRDGWGVSDGKIELFATTEKAIIAAINFANTIGI